MTHENLRAACSAVATEFITLFQILLEDHGLNIRARENTLAPDSRLYKTLKKGWTKGDGGIIVSLAVNQYIDYIERGRPIYYPNPEKKVPIGALRKWAMSKGLPTTNDFLYAVQTVIWKEGIRPRPILYYFWEEVQNSWESWASAIFDALIEDFKADISQ